MEYEKLEKKISAYIEYLKKEYHLLVSIHFAEEYTYVFSKSKQLLQYNVHQNPYCFMIKNEKKKLNKCILCQKLALKKCRAHESYTGICHAKVLEYVCRIYTGNKAAGFVSVSGYRDKKVPFGQSEIYDENMKNSIYFDGEYTKNEISENFVAYKKIKLGRKNENFGILSIISG